MFQLAHLHCSECLLEHLIDYQLVLECVHHLTQTLVLLALFKNGLLKNFNLFYSLISIALFLWKSRWTYVPLFFKSRWIKGKLRSDSLLKIKLTKWVLCIQNLLLTNFRNFLLFEWFKILIFNFFLIILNLVKNFRTLIFRS